MTHSAALKNSRSYPVGAEILPDGGVSFRVWAPRSSQVSVEISSEETWETPDIAVDLSAEESGWFSGVSDQARAGIFYKLRLNSGFFPDPASRFQPQGPHGASMIVDPRQFRWTDSEWRGVGREKQVLYEMHIGTFTPEGTWAAAAEQLDELAQLGITTIELMPVAEFAGRFGWGYDGVDLFAPTRLYGTPDDFRAFVDRAHAAGLGVILDVVYNHLGPDGNYLKEFSEHYFTARYQCEWGEALNFDGEHSGPVREFFTANAMYWIAEFHLDGLRLDATQQIFDSSEEHVITRIARCAREAAGERSLYLVGENEPQDTNLLRPASEGGCGLDALWNDDFHHTAAVALTGRREAYYSDYLATPQEFVSAAKWGYLYQGQLYQWQKKRRGTPTVGLPPSALINFLQNHDQVANSALGARIHTLSAPGAYRAMTALLLLLPATPMLFQGQEFAASACFHYFADHKPELAELVEKGRREFLEQFPSTAKPETKGLLRPPHEEETFRRSKLDFHEREQHAEIYAMHRELLQLRRTDAVFGNPGSYWLDGAVLGDRAFVLRFFGKGDESRLLIVNLERDLHLHHAPEPLLAPVPGCGWDLLWSSEDPRFGGAGTPEPETEENWRIPGRAAIVLIPKRGNELTHE